MSAYGSMWPPAPSFIANLASQDVYANTQTTLTAIGSGGGGGGGGGGNLTVSSLTVLGVAVPGGNVGITVNVDPGDASASLPILFNSVGQDTIASGVLEISKDSWLGVNSEQVSGLAVQSFSTIYGSFQPVVVGDLYINNSDGSGAGTGRISYVDSVSSMSLVAAGGGVSISSINTSTINGISFNYIISTLQGLSPGGFSPPSAAPTVPVFISSDRTSIRVNFDVAGITGNPTPTYNVLWGTTTSPTNVYPATFQSGTSYTATVTGLTPGTTYYFKSQATNSAGTQNSAASPAFSTISGGSQTNVSTILAVGFFTYESSFILDTATNVDVGNWDVKTGQITYPSPPSVTAPEYLSSIKGNGSKVVLSMGGGQANATVLSTMFGLDDGISLAQSVNYTFFNGSGSNPLDFKNSDWTGFSFDGIDLDIEAATPTASSLYTFTSTLKGLNPSIIVTAAPQSPYLTQGTGSGLNANGAFASFSAMNAGTNLSAVYTGNAGNQLSLLSPTNGGLIDYNFIQCYNNAAYSYPTGPTNANWNNVVAAWGIQSLKAGNKCIFAFATVDGAPIWDSTVDATAFNASLATANSTIRGFSTTTGVFPYSSVNIDQWCSGIGFWASSSSPGGTSNSINALSTSYATSILANCPADYCMTYAGVYQNNSWGWDNSNAPVPNARGF